MPVQGVRYDLTAACQEARRWLVNLRADGGPDLTVYADIKAHEESAELCEAETPADRLEEAADTLIALMGVLLREGQTVEQLAEAVARKTEVNKARNWRQLPNGTWRHS